MADWRDEYNQMIEDCENRDRRMNEWERGFIESLKAQLKDERIPTMPQIEKLNDIWEKVTSKG